MTCSWLGVAVAGGGALAHIGFAYVEIIKWSPAKVREIAPTWLEGLTESDAAHVVGWAKPLAFNIGVYNLVLALGLAWTCRVFWLEAPTARSLGIFFAVWLLGAAAAAYHTQVNIAVIAQGLLGVGLLIAALCV